MNLIVELKELLGGEVSQKAAFIVGEKEDKVKLALEGLVPTIIGGVMKRASNEAGATTLMNAIQKGNHDGSILTQLPSFLQDKESFTVLTDKGHSLVSMLLPDKKSSIATLISQYAGVRNSSATSLLAFAMPVVIGRFGKIVAIQGADKVALANAVLDLKSSLIGETPEKLQVRMIDVLGLSVFMSQEIKPIQFASAAPIKSQSIQAPAAPKPIEDNYVTYSNKDYDNASREREPMPKWVIPAALIAVVLGGLGYFLLNYDWKSAFGNSDEASDSLQVEQVTGAQIDTTALPKDTTLSKVDSTSIPEIKPVNITLPNGQALDVISGSFSDRFTKYLSDSSAKASQLFTLDNVNFEGNTSTLVAGGDKTVQDLVKIMTAYPRVQIKLIGHTDNTGDTLQSKKLSLKRAFAVRNLLVAGGISAIRIDFDGKGPFVPLTSNATEEGKARNRRIEIKVVRK
ncbi:DUF937 domain-containing protein [Flectobacillus major]|jgi:outer membrane protein OmpA-like peptidoglycan-associated protein|uniref:DUF937 domain-containing protein n=1 Tax=Flectobacillus major TaxID=103 RepID=UPI000408D993|nr:DUF937 domain-containing protein [Flectobacillus major]